MPELPEVECARRFLDRVAVGKRIVQFDVVERGGGPRHGLVDDIVNPGADAVAAASACQGAVLESVHRKGKHLWWVLAFADGDGPRRRRYITWHLGMTGGFSAKAGTGGATPELSVKYVSTTPDLSQWPPRFTKVLVTLDDGGQVAFTDPRRLGRVRVMDEAPATQPPIAELGYDVLTQLPSLPDFVTLLRARGGCATIKATLLDQRVVSGIGNWIADEVLYQSAIHPATTVPALDATTDLARLHASLRDVVTTAVDADADSSRFPVHWLFRHRWNKGQRGVKDHAGRPVTFVTVAGRTSAVVTAVQVGPHTTPRAPPATATTSPAATAPAVSSGDTYLTLGPGAVAAPAAATAAAGAGAGAVGVRRRRWSVGMGGPLGLDDGVGSESVPSVLPRRGRGGHASRPVAQVGAAWQVDQVTCHMDEGGGHNDHRQASTRNPGDVGGDMSVPTPPPAKRPRRASRVR